MTPKGTYSSIRGWQRLILLLALLAGVLRIDSVFAATYTHASTPFNWINASAHARVGYNTAPYRMNGGGTTGCGTTPPTLDDTISDAIPIGFNFTYGTTVYTSVRIMSNGRLQFGNTTCGFGTQDVGPPQTYPYPYPDGSLVNTMKVFGVDLDPTNLVDVPNYPSSTNKTSCTSSVTCYISYASIGTAPNRQFVVTWKNVPEWVSTTNSSGSFDLQVILSESGNFTYQYGTNVHGGTGTAQIGWELTTTDYETLLFGASSEPPANTSIIFYKPSSSPIAEYRFDEGAWNSGAAGQVADYSGGNHAGTALGSAQEIAAGYLCRGASITANTSAGVVDAVQTGINISDTSLTLSGQGTITFWYKANAAWNSGTAAQLLDATQVNGQWFYLTKTATGSLFLEVTDSTGVNRSVETAAQTFAAGTWVHVAISWNFNASPLANQDTLSIFINGAAPTTAAFSSNGTISSSVGYLSAGDNGSGFIGTKGTVNSANGTIDELRFYNFGLNQGQVAGVRAETRTCTTYAIDHFELRHASWSGPACVPGTLTVLACANAACSSLYTSGVIATLSSSGAATIWDAASGGNTVIIGNTQSSTTKDFYTGVGTATFDIAGTGAPVSPANAKKCNGVAGSCAWTATSGGLLVSVPNSGVIVGGQPTAVTVQAVQSTGPTPAAPCTPVAGLSGAGLKLWSTPSSPASFSGTSTSAGVTVGGNPQVANASAGTYAYTPLAVPAADNVSSLAFDSNAQTTVWLKHMDTGAWSLSARLDKAASATSPALTLNGSATVVSIPVGFGVASTSVTAPAATQTACASGPSAACDAAAAAAAKVAAAGAGFSSLVTAALWTVAGDTNLSDNPVAPGYAGTVALSPALAAPQGGAGGTLGVGSVSLAGGQATIAAQTWSQAGAVRIFGSASYQGQSINPAGAGQQTILNPVLGRFSAHHFVVAPSNACGVFTYSGQPFSAVKVTAMTADAVAVKDVNFTGGFARKVTLSDANAFAGGSLKISGAAPDILASSFSSGEATVQPTYTFASVNTAPTSIKIRATDTDGAVSSGESASEIRSGRLWLANAFGSEFLALKVPVQAQYWASSGWRQNSADNCTSLTMPTRQDSGNGGLKFYAPPNDSRNALAPGEVVAQMNGSTAASVTVTAGDARLVLRHPTAATQGPGAGNFGYLDIIGSKLTNSAWLPPTGNARACFGSCGPRSPVIYFRENY